MARTWGPRTPARGRLALLTAACLCAAPAGSATAERPYGDAKVLAQVPTPPGFPEGIAVRDGRVYVAGPATFGTTGKPPSSVVAFDAATGDQVASYFAVGEDLQREHANSSIAFDAAGRLYVLNTQLGIYRLTLPDGGQQYHSEPFPDIPPCSPAGGGTCSPTPQDAPPIPNDLAFDADGNAYVTDSMQATIWRVPGAPDADGKRVPAVWYQDEQLASEYIGVNGIRFAPDRTRLYVTVTTDLTGRSFVYTLPFSGAGGTGPSSAALEPFHEYTRGELPDGIAFGASGLLYVAMATPGASGVSVLARQEPSGGAPRAIETVRLANPLGSPAHPYDSPANIAFRGDGSILLTNHAFVTGAVLPTQFTVLDVAVADTGAPLEEPVL